jgi:trimeric autotransporter adhesin
MKCLSPRKAFHILNHYSQYYCARKKSSNCRMKNLRLYILILLTILSTNLFAQGTYNTLGSINNGCNDKVFAITGEQPQTSVIYVGGSFTNAGGSPAKYVAKWDQDAFAWTNMQPHGGMNGPVRSLLYFNSTLYAAGDFIISDSIDTWHVARWTGAQWTNMAGGIRGAGLRALKAYSNEIYAAGYIDTLSGFNPGMGVEKWNGSTWVALGGFGYGVSGANGFHGSAMEVYNGELYVGGLFSFAGNGSIPANNIAKWNGSNWAGLGNGANGEVFCFTVFNGELYAGGDFTNIDGVPANRIAKFNGSTWSAVGAGFDTTVYGLAVYQNEVYATGNFITSAGDTMLRIARWNGSAWNKVWNGLGIPGLNFTGYCLTPNDSSLYVGGFFTVAGTEAAICIARYYINTVSVDELTSEDVASVYPNPTTGNLTIEWKNSSAEKTTAEIYSVDGKLLLHHSEQNPFSKTSLDLTHLPKGFYFLKLEADKAITSGKLIID